MAEVSAHGAVRTILEKHPNLPTKEIIRRAKLRGVTASDKSITHAIYNMRSELRKEVAATAPVKVVSAAAHETAPPKAATPAPAAPTAASDLDSVLGNVELVNKIVDLCGGVESARQTAEAVQACGGVEAFLQHLALVGTIRGSAKG